MGKHATDLQNPVWNKVKWDLDFRFYFTEVQAAIFGSRLVSARQVIAGRMLQEDKKTRGHNLVPRDNIDFSRRPCYRDGTQSTLPLDSVAPGF
jgi:hypothetical protein